MATSIRLFEQAAHADIYSKFRLIYPVDVLERINKFMDTHSQPMPIHVAPLGDSTTSQSQPPVRRARVAADVGCGSGQSTFYLCDRFDSCVGVDISKSQIENALKKKADLEKGGNRMNVEFKVARGEKLPFADASIDLLTIAQAWHWVDPVQFNREVARVLKPEGCFAVYGYDMLGNMSSEECKRLVWQFYSSLKGLGYWHENRGIVENHYKDFVSPFTVTERQDFEMTFSMTLPHAIGYIQSWSAYQTLCEKDADAGKAMIEELKTKMTEALKFETRDLSLPCLDWTFSAFLIMSSKE